MAKKEIEHSSNLHKMKPLRAASLRGFFSFYVVEHLQVSYPTMDKSLSITFRFANM